MAEVTRINPNDFTLQFYESQDEALLASYDINTVLTSSSVIEFFVYDNNKNLLYANNNFTQYRVENNGQTPLSNDISSFNIDPEESVTGLGFNQGDYVSYYNFLNNKIGTGFSTLYLKEISSDRTEIRLDSVSLTNLDIVEQTNNFIQEREDSDYFVDFYVNFGGNRLIIANNIKLDNDNTSNPTVLIKLYEPLPSDFSLKNKCWVTTTFNEPEAYKVSYPPEPISLDDTVTLSGPNFNLPLKDRINNSTQNLSYNDLTTGAPTSSLNQLNSLLNTASLSISVDYTDFSDFVHFSSAKTRLENFYYKVGLIESYSASIADLVLVTASATSMNLLENKISNVIQNFDNFEYFLYYNSGSTDSSGSLASWPKTTTEPPYLLAKTGSTQVLNWLGSDIENSSYYGGRIFTSSEYDNQNKDQLLKSIPEYLREDSSNQPYELFVDMVAQYYDNIWLYTKDLTQKYNADNRLDYGVSKDLVADAIRDFGVKLYQNNFSKDELYTAFLGITPSGSIFPFPEITGSLPTPTGFEYVNTKITASNDIIPLDDVNKSLYKRLYHNIPYLLKSKGTIAGLRALITSYGVPDTILKISEFGGKDKVNENDWDYYFNKFNYAFDTNGNNYLYSYFRLFRTDTWQGGVGSGNQIPRTVEFRFKAENSPPTNASQSLWTLGLTDVSSSIVLEYSGSGLDTGSLVNESGSYSGSIKSPFYQYGTLKYINNAGESASAYLPFFNNDWWSVMVTVDSNLTASLYTGNKIYNGKDGTSIGYYSSSKTPATGWTSSLSATSSFGKPYTGYQNFSGSFQEIRYYVPTISESVFKDYIMNPLSIEGNSVNSSSEEITWRNSSSIRSYNELSFRAALGSELDITTTQSIHPKITGSWLISGVKYTSVPSFVTPAGLPDSDYNFATPPSYSTNTEYYFLDQFPAGIKNRITDKIRYENNVLPSGDTLSPFRRITQQTEASESYTENTNLLEVSFSPQNEINDDIINQFGYFNIGDYIGDPRQRSSSLNYYPDLNNLSEDYFQKYFKSYDLVDFVRLIKFFDNSLFKMIKDFVPARTSLASGIVIKQHLLERNKYPQPQSDINTPIAEYVGAYTSSYNQPILRQNLLLSGTVAPQWNDYNSGSLVNPNNGGAGGVMNPYNSLQTSPVGSSGSGPNNDFNITQSWAINNMSLSGSIPGTHDSQAEFFNGEFSGSAMLVSNGELNSECDEFKNISTTSSPYTIRIYSSQSGYDFGTWMEAGNEPLIGYVSMWYSSGSDGTELETSEYDEAPIVM